MFFIVTGMTCRLETFVVVVMRFHFNQPDCSWRHAARVTAHQEKKKLSVAQRAWSCVVFKEKNPQLVQLLFFEAVFKASDRL